MQPVSFLFLGITLLPGVLVAQSAKPIVVEHLRQAPSLPPGDLLPRLQGKPAVLEFWTTWCAPCIAAMPRLSQLAQQYEGKVQFVSLTYEQPELVDRFLSRHTPAGWIAMDTDESVFKSYDVEAYPTTIVLTAQGQVIELHRTADLTAQLLDRLIAGTIQTKTDVYPVRAAAATTSAEPEDKEAFSLRALMQAKPSAKLEIGPARKAGTSISSVDMGMVLSPNISTQQLYALAYGVQEQQVEGDTAVLNRRWAVAMKAGSKQVMQAAIRQQLDSLLHVTSDSAVRPQQVYLAKQESPAAAYRKQVPAKTSATFSNAAEEGVIIGRNARLSALYEALGEVLHKPVEAEAPSETEYDFDLIWNPKGGEPALLEALRTQLGIMLTPTTKQVMLVQVR